MSRKKREPRPKPPTEVPLDDGARDGTEVWRDLDGLSFCHWDRWLLRLSLDTPDGLAGIVGEFGRRARWQRRNDLVAEAMLAQLATSRHASRKWAERRVLCSTIYTWSWKVINRSSPPPAMTSASRFVERFSVQRSARWIMSMTRVTISGSTFASKMRAYLEILKDYVERPGLMRNLLELTTWEDYGLIRQIEPFLGQLSEPAANLALDELEFIVAELREAGLEYQCGKAVRLQLALQRAGEAFCAASNGVTV